MSIIRLVCPEPDISTTSMFVVKSSADIHDHQSRIANNQSFFPSATIRTKVPLEPTHLHINCCQISILFADIVPRGRILMIWETLWPIRPKFHFYTTSIGQITIDVSEHIHAFQRMNPFHFGLAFQNTILRIKCPIFRFCYFGWKYGSDIEPKIYISESTTAN